ncbi:uncharacterized protein BJ212DRAFT_1474166 [Suillus subaureus]|uniref:Uncharacterized protein n=1 Tax=Suillus subaureus TaxID=48587 RepID=A0A9P7JK88_9AGAM|nr:uncharacterized protein BJ212DRAFT_1474166 [Suillus subaureus]KAG1826964.1 hypothetical protein BJ212DRAFT_1474166 [Suillus subaureus]
MTDSHHSDSSIEIISSISCCATGVSEDEVVWSVSDEYSSESSVTDSDADYVLLPRISAEDFPDDASDDSAQEDMLLTAFNLLSVNKAEHEPYANKVNKPIQKTRKPAKHEARQANAGNSGLTCSSSTSPSLHHNSGAKTPNGYEDAAAYITQYLDAPVKENDPSTKLLFLQALVVEFGISKQLPASISSATKLLKASVHVNIKDYIARRGKDQGELQQIMQPSKSALRKDIRRSNRRSSLKWVKEHGLNVLLIGFSN